jgi:5-oxoprolinase (ATP-hydrolysing) subunit C
VTGRGGMHGRPLAEGDVISAGEPQAPPHLGVVISPPPYADRTLRVIEGPHIDRLAPAARQVLFSSVFHVSPHSDRMGYRLDGPPLETSAGELLSFGLVAGVVQLPPGGQPILLMADHQTAGGYPVVMTVTSASMPVAAQLAPGDEVRFEATTIGAALEARADQRAALDLSTS